jgi:hypothetical protein
MTGQDNRVVRRAVSMILACVLLIHMTAGSSGAYALGSIVADMRQGASRSGGTSCPQLTRFDVSTPGQSIASGAQCMD